MVEVKEDKAIYLSYERWLGSNVVEIDRRFNSGDFPRAHEGITTLFMNMVTADRKGFLEFMEKHNGDYERMGAREAEQYLRGAKGSWREILLTSEWREPRWRNIYMGLIDYFASRGYLFKTRTIQVGTEVGGDHGVSFGRDDSASP